MTSHADINFNFIQLEFDYYLTINGQMHAIP